MALTDVIGRLAEVNEEQLLETQNIKIEIESLSDRFASFIRIAEGDKLDKLEERREERKKSRGMGFTGRAKEAAQQAKQTGLTLIDLLVKGAGLAVAAGVIIPLLMQNEEVKEALGDLGTALGESVSLVLKKVAPVIGKILGDTLLAMVPGLNPKKPEDVSPITPEESTALNQFRMSVQQAEEAGTLNEQGYLTNRKDANVLGARLATSIVPDADLKSFEQRNELVERLKYLVSNDPSFNDLTQSEKDKLVINIDRSVGRLDPASEEKFLTTQKPFDFTQKDIRYLTSFEKEMNKEAEEEEKQTRDAIRESAKSVSRSKLPDTSLQSMATLAAQSSMGMGEFNILKGLMNVFKDGKKREEIDALGQQSLDMMYPDLASDVFAQKSAIAQNVLYPSVSSKMPAISQLRGAASDGNNVTIINNNVTSGSGPVGSNSTNLNKGASYVSGDSKHYEAQRSAVIGGSAGSGGGW